VIILQALETVAGAERLIEKTGDAWAWSVAGICLLVSLGSLIWCLQKVAAMTATVQGIYAGQQLRDDQKTTATHQAMADVAKAMQEIAFGLRSVPEPLKAAVAPIVDKVDALRADIQNLISKLDRK